MQPGLEYSVNDRAPIREATAFGPASLYITHIEIQFKIKSVGFKYMRFKTEELHSEKLKGENKLPIESYCPAVFRARSLTALCWLAGEMFFNSFRKKVRTLCTFMLVSISC